MSSEEPLFLSPEEASWVLSMTPQSVRFWVREGKLRAAPRIGRHHRIYFDSVMEYAGISRETVLAILQRKRSEKTPRTRRAAQAEAPPNKSRVLLGVSI